MRVQEISLSPWPAARASALPANLLPFILTARAGTAAAAVAAVPGMRLALRFGAATLRERLLAIAPVFSWQALSD